MPTKNESRETFATILAEQSPRDWWIASTQHRTHRGDALDFARHRFQVAILQDPAQHKVVAKATQCGISELEAGHALSLCDQGRRVFWVFPNEILRNQFVKDRLDLCIANTPHYQMLVARARQQFKARNKDASDDVTIKQIGTGAIALVGSNSIASFKSFTADDVIIDELDQCDQQNLAMAPDRFAASKWRTTWKVGNPTISGYGIDALYADSDRKRWFIQCQHCNERQALDWFVNVVREVTEGTFEIRSGDTSTGDISALCRRCERPLDRLSDGEWIAEQPGRSVSGYQINQIFSGSVPLSEMWAAFQDGLANESKRQRFYNSVLGIAYSPEGAKLSRARLDACVDSERGQASTGKGCYVGVDVGSLLHVIVIDHKDRVINITTLREFSELSDLVEGYNAECVVIDAMPETRLARQWAEGYWRQAGVFLCTYVRAKDQVREYKIDPEEHRVVADRTQSMDESHAAIMQRKISLPRDAASIPDFYDQMMAPTRTFDEVQQRFIWNEGSAPDHYRHAFNYAWLARGIRDSIGRVGAWVV